MLDQTSCIRLFVSPRRFEDERGMFHEVFHSLRMAEHFKTEVLFSQVNLSKSKAGVLRGIHYQWPNPMGKFVTCVEGEIVDFVVDLRTNAPTFKRWWDFSLSEKNGYRLWVPPTCGHAFYAVTDATVVYGCTRPFVEDCDRNVLWCDPEIGIKWPFEGSPSLSVRDASAPFLCELRNGGKYVLPRSRDCTPMQVQRS